MQIIDGESKLKVRKIESENRVVDQSVKKGWESIEVEKLKGGDSEQASTFLNLMVPRIKLMARSSGCSKQESANIAQDAIIKLFTFLHKYEPLEEESPAWYLPVTNPSVYERFRSWCYRVSLNIVREEIRKRPRQKSLSSEVVKHDLRGWDPSSQYESALLLDELLQQLDETERRILLLTYVEELKAEEIAKILQMDEREVRKQKEEILAKLRKASVRTTKQTIWRTGGTLGVKSE